MSENSLCHYLVASKILVQHIHTTMDSDDDESFQDLDLLPKSKPVSKESNPDRKKPSTTLPELAISQISIHGRKSSSDHHTPSGIKSPIELPLTEPRSQSSAASHLNSRDHVNPAERHDRPKRPSNPGSSNSNDSSLRPQVSATSDTDPLKRLVIAIDYGTTFTGKGTLITSRTVFDILYRSRRRGSSS